MVRTWGEAREEDGLKNHVDLVLLLDLVDLEAGTAVAGARSVLQDGHVQDTEAALVSDNGPGSTSALRFRASE